ncbi:MAG TPA: GPO family capsid scaffolding protein, partial [Sphingopyxis terrae]|nr:GPO family capsid scaffolding protein [Sphingopyxis terrae]
MPKSKFFRVAVEGATVDGRTIDRKWLEEMAATYNRTTYAARVNLEHIRGIAPLGNNNSPFGAYGDVLSVKTDTVDIALGGKTEKRLALFAEIEALDPLVELVRKGQKLYTSIEVNPSFADTGKAYLMGLAVTDTPASLGTEMLEFSAKL